MTLRGSFGVVGLCLGLAGVAHAKTMVAVRAENVVGDLVVADADKVLSRKASSVKGCFRSVLKEDPEAQGQVFVELRVGPNGKVESATASGFPGGPDECIQKALARARFDKSATGATVTAVVQLNMALAATAVAPGPAPEASARIRLEEAEVSPGIDLDAVKRVVEMIAPPVQECYLTRLRAVPSLSGTLQVSFEVSDKGKVTRADAIGMLDPQLVDCALRPVRALAFPAGPPFVMVQPIRFIQGKERRRPSGGDSIAGGAGPSGMGAPGPRAKEMDLGGALGSPYRGRVVVRVLNPEVKSGTLKPADIKKAVKKRMKHFERCYRAALDQNPTIAGPMMVVLHMKDGRVNIGSIAGIDPSVASCARYQLQMIAAPAAPSGDVTIATVGILFSTKD